MGIIDSCFDEYILKGQNIFQDPKIISFVLGFVRNYFNHKKDIDSFEKKLKDILENTRLDSSTKWNNMYRELEYYDNEKIPKGNEYTKRDLCLMDIKLNILYPRLDINVSKHINHLLKSPFCIHPKTGLISVPLSEKDIINFNLENIPHVDEALDEFNENK